MVNLKHGNCLLHHCYNGDKLHDLNKSLKQIMVIIGNPRSRAIILIVSGALQHPSCTGKPFSADTGNVSTRSILSACEFGDTRAMPGA